jgi:DNA polymerase III delta prime subunit
VNFSISQRPTKLDDVFSTDPKKGTGHVKTYIKSKIKKGDFPASVIFSGKFGTGKTTMAKIYAATLACKTPDKDGNPCGECLSCKAIFEEKWSRDVILIDPANLRTKGSTIVNEFSEKLDEFASFPARRDRNKVCIIEEVQELKDTAKNSMLKLLERPMPGFYFILLTMDDIATSGFSSRSQVFKFIPFTTEDVARYLFKTCKDLSIPISEDKIPALFAIAGASSGSLRLAIQNLERVFDVDMWDANDIRRELGSIDEVANIELLEKICNGKVDESTFTYLLEEHDFDKVFKFNYSAICAADAYREFGVTTGASYVKSAGFDAMSETEQKAFETSASKRAFAIENSTRLLINNPNFSIVRDGFRKASLLYAKDNYSNDILKSDYILMLCEIARNCKKTSVPQHLQENTETPKVRRIK